jgi:hypothetical protein
MLTYRTAGSEYILLGPAGIARSEGTRYRCLRCICSFGLPPDDKEIGVSEEEDGVDRVKFGGGNFGLARSLTGVFG